MSFQTSINRFQTVDIEIDVATMKHIDGSLLFNHTKYMRELGILLKGKLEGYSKRERNASNILLILEDILEEMIKSYNKDEDTFYDIDLPSTILPASKKGRSLIEKIADSQEEQTSFLESPIGILKKIGIYYAYYKIEEADVQNVPDDKTEKEIDPLIKETCEQASNILSMPIGHDHFEVKNGVIRLRKLSAQVAQSYPRDIITLLQGIYDDTTLTAKK